ncbi:protein-export chaperone SecB [Aurantiacibacter sp. D1-12]|uniref:protein-export chaperone SecB n=1 Tax=Aurantiacibacter sp. D1-12 TaxID=2993658 RepID=UPI00237CDB7E|nr:protein-export chaperone SecB [Aurantiacibacter sp. D1-12]MDE1467220.1 protein-export chaperone SecB [Aurantiacibacter sp. D1-12]
MADEGDVLKNLDDNNAAPVGNGADNQPVAGIVSQYVKDLSVENPKAPESFQWRDKPEMDVQFNIGGKKVNDELTEVELKITATSKTAQGTAYIVDLAYCGLVGMRNMPEEQQHAFMYAEAPRILFPFARRVISDAVRDAGFTPLMLDPIDFNGLYVQQLQAQRAGEAAGGAAPAAGNAPGGEG